MKDKTETGTVEAGELVDKPITDADIAEGKAMVAAQEMGQAAIPEPRAVSWMDSEPEMLSRSLERRSQNRQQVMEWVWCNLVEGTDYGRIHVVRDCPNKKKGCDVMSHYSKPSLWKAGAEKIAGMLNLRAEWPELVDMLERLRDGSKVIALRCLLIDQYGNIVSEGAGARSLDSDYGDPNKALKMAKKSSLIDAVLNAAGLSEVFTQDEIHEQATSPDGCIDETGQKFLRDRAKELFGDQADTVLESLARRRFRFADGDWKRIPAWRLQDAIRSLDEKAGEQNSENPITEENNDPK